MALAPYRLLVPMRAVEPANPAGISSASVRSSAVAYPCFSLFFFHSPHRRHTLSVTAWVLDLRSDPSVSRDRSTEFQRRPFENASFDDLPPRYGEELDGSSYPTRYSHGKPHPAVKFGRERVSRNGGSYREPSIYSPWYSRRGSGRGGMSRHTQPWSSRSSSRNSSSRISHTSQESPATFRGRSEKSYVSSDDRRTQDRETFQGRSQQAFLSEDSIDMQNASSDGWDLERRTFFQGENRYDGRGSPPWKRGGHVYGQRNGQSGHREPSGGSWEGEYNEKKKGSVAWRQRKRYDAEAERERHMGHGQPWQSRAGQASPWYATASAQEISVRNKQHSYARQSTFRGIESSNPGFQSSHSIAPWQINLPTERRASGDESGGVWTKIEEKQEPNNDRWELEPRGSGFGEGQRKTKESQELSNDRWELEPRGNGLGEGQTKTKESQELNNKVQSESPITRLIKKLSVMEDEGIPSLGKTRYNTGIKLADSLDLPIVTENLSTKSIKNLPIEKPEQGEVDTRFPWEIEEVKAAEDGDVAMARKVKPLSLAELTIPGPELKRLRVLSIHLKQRVKIGKSGVSTDLVTSIKQRWKSCEVVKVKCEGPCAGNMKKTLETLEKRTEGMVIWKAGSVAVLYRGKNFGQPISEVVDDLLTKKLQKLMSAEEEEAMSRANDDVVLQEEVLSQPDNVGAIQEDIPTTQEARHQKAERPRWEFDKIEEYVEEVDDLLKGLGPRYQDWTGAKPVPIDADLLPPFIPNYTPPYRLLPFGVRPNISGTLTTHLRRLSRPLSPHFVLGRERGLQGLAAAMVKVWEKSEIVKIGIKRGVLNTNQERIVEDLKQLTGGVFLCRDKSSITFHRGKDFLPPAVAAALAERQAMAHGYQYDEEVGRAERSITVMHGVKSTDSRPSWVHLIDPEEQVRLKKEAARARRIKVVYHLERKLKMVLRKKEMAGIELEKVESLLKPVGPSEDKETITDEERFMLRKLGIKMGAFLLVGRRGVFSGVVQNMHLHWKHRELVKIIIKERDPIKLQEFAELLESESGGILVAVEPTSKGYAIIVYRGKNYSRPAQLRPPNLLTKRLALKRSVEIQRRAALTRHIQALQEEISYLRAGLSKISIDNSEDNAEKKCTDVDDYVKVGDGPQEIQSTNGEGRSILSEGQQESMANKVMVSERSMTGGEMMVSKISKRKLNRLCELGPVFRAGRLSRVERHHLREEVLKMQKTAHFLVGSSVPISNLAKAIRQHFLHNAFVKIGVKGRPRGTSIQDVAEELEDLTGGTLYAQNESKIIMYRGWPNGESMPLGDIYNVLSPEQCDILEEEDSVEDESDGEEGVMGNELQIKDTLVEYMETDYDEEEEDDDDDYEEEDGEDGYEEDEDGLLVNESLVENMEKNDEEEEEGYDDEVEGGSTWDMMWEEEDYDEDEEGDEDDVDEYDEVVAESGDDTRIERKVINAHNGASVEAEHGEHSMNMGDDFVWEDDLKGDESAFSDFELDEDMSHAYWE